MSDNIDESGSNQELEYLEDIAAKCQTVLDEAEYKHLQYRFGISQPPYKAREE